MHLVGIQNIGPVTGMHKMENFKIADEILASLESLYSTQCTVCSSILTLLTIYNGMNNYKRSLRLKFSTGFIHKEVGLQIHLQTRFAVTFLVAQMKFRPISPVDITDKLHCDLPTLNTHFWQVHTSFTHFQGNHKNKNKKNTLKFPEHSRGFWKLHVEVKLTDKR